MKTDNGILVNFLKSGNTFFFLACWHVFVAFALYENPQYVLMMKVYLSIITDVLVRLKEYKLPYN